MDPLNETSQDLLRGILECIGSLLTFFGHFQCRGDRFAHGSEQFSMDFERPFRFLYIEKDDVRVGKTSI